MGGVTFEQVNPQCPICMGGAEDMRHLMFTCQRAKEVWRSLGLWEIIDKALVVDKSGSVTLEELIRGCGKSPILGMKHLKETVAVRLSLSRGSGARLSSASMLHQLRVLLLRFMQYR